MHVWARYPTTFRRGLFTDHDYFILILVRNTDNMHIPAKKPHTSPKLRNNIQTAFQGNWFHSALFQFYC